MDPKEHVAPPPSNRHTQHSILRQNIISRARWFGIYFLHRGKKRKIFKRWIYPEEEAGTHRGWQHTVLKNPQERGEGAAGLRQEPWQESNYFGLSQCYLTFLLGGVNPDTATVQLQKQHPLILLMPSSLQYRLIKEALARLDNRPRLLCNCSRWWWKSSFPPSFHLFCKSKSKNLFG